MCAWCWGFAPVAEALARQAAAEAVAFHLVAGGLRAGPGAALAPNTRSYILGHWQPVRQAPGPPCRFEAALPDGVGDGPW
ncbi:DsbA family protein, partial [Pseudomonas aeruginosa]|nr:DsbA family protein [Pseudomonas aeruginosa]